MTSPNPIVRRSRFGAAPLLALSWLAGCALLGEVGEDYSLHGNDATAGVGGDGGGGGSADTAGVGGVGGTAGPGAVGGAGGVGGGERFPPGSLGGPCDGSTACMEGECCTDNACEDTCATKCDDVSDCPDDDNWGCEHGYCLAVCSVDTDCLQAGFNCHHMCSFCEKKNSQNCE